MDRHSLHDLLRQHRLAAGFTQQQLAERAGISTRSIGYLESGTGHIPRVDTLRLLAEALALSADEATHLLQAAVPMSGTSGNSSLVSHSIPLPPTLLVGRSGALEELCSLLKLSAARLLTLTGTGGVGKTHLALTLAHRMGATFPDGMTFVDLAPLREAESVPFAIAQALQVQDRGPHLLLAQLQQHLQGRRHLLILDTFEHVLSAAPLLAALLAECPLLKVLVTSRVPLHLRGEQVYSVAPLALPSDAALTALETLAAIPAIDLFLARVRAYAPTFLLSADNAAHVAAICRQLDGLPLALELAAPRLAVLTPASCSNVCRHRSCCSHMVPRISPPASVRCVPRSRGATICCLKRPRPCSGA
jgi:transcriptional regulator with XRE-family HTH domain